MTAAEREQRFIGAFFRATPEQQRLHLQSLWFFVDERIQVQAVEALERASGAGLHSEQSVGQVKNDATEATNSQERDMPGECNAHGSTPARQPMPAPAGAAADGGEAAALGRNADFAAVPFQSPLVAIAHPNQPLPVTSGKRLRSPEENARVLALMEQMNARRRPCMLRPVRDHFPIGAVMTRQEVCRRLAISRATLDRELRSDRFPQPFKVAGCFRWRLADVEKYLMTLNDSEAVIERYLPRSCKGRIVSSSLDNEMLSLVERLAAQRKASGNEANQHDGK